MRQVPFLLIAALLLPSTAFSTNWALEFDGMDDYVIMRQFSMEYDALTVEAWVHPMAGGTPDLAYEIVGFPTGISDQVHFQLESNDDFVMFDPATSDCRLYGSHIFTDDEWYHIAAVYG